MQILLSLAGLIALLCFATMCIYIIIALKASQVFMLKAAKSLDETVKTVNQIEAKLSVTLATANDTLENTSTTVLRLDKQLESIETGIQDFNAIAKRVNQLEMSLQKKIEGPLMQAASVVSGVAKAVSAISSSWSGGKRK
jgi:uncharacterized protein YoxC